MLMRFSITGVLLALVASAILIPASAQMSEKEYDTPSTERVKGHLEEGKKTFRFDTFGDEQLWTDTLRMQHVIMNLSPRTALSVGLKVDQTRFHRQ